MAGADAAEPSRASLESVASSLLEHVEENGRTYHRYKSGSRFRRLPLGLWTGRVEPLANVVKQNTIYPTMKYVLCWRRSDDILD
jgi:hypothetical protein